MPHDDFKIYLELLSRLLGLTSRQRAAIAAEIEDHLEQRLADLERSGVAHDAAVRIALEELGDAAVLAQRFCTLARWRNRRLLMRWSFASMIVAAFAATYALNLWLPGGGPIGPGQPVVAQQPPAGASGPAADPAGDALAPPRADAGRLRMAARLDSRIPEIAFVEVPLHEAIEHLEDLTDTRILLDKAALAELGVDLDAAVSLELKDVSLRSVLELLLELEGLDDDIGIGLRDNFLFLTKKTKTYFVEVYNCRDLVAAEWPPAEVGAAGGGGSPAGFSPNSQGGLGGFAGSGGSAGSMMPGTLGQRHETVAFQEQKLVEAVKSTVVGPWTEVDGEGGSISIVNGLLIVRHSAEVHHRVDELLTMLRRAENAAPNAKPTAER